MAAAGAVAPGPWPDSSPRLTHLSYSCVIALARRSRAAELDFRVGTVHPIRGEEEAAAGGARRQAVGPERRPRRVGFAFLALSRLGAGCAHCALGSASHWLAARRFGEGLRQLGGGDLHVIGGMASGAESGDRAGGRGPRGARRRWIACAPLAPVAPGSSGAGAARLRRALAWARLTFQLSLAVTSPAP